MPYRLLLPMLLLAMAARAGNDPTWVGARALAVGGNVVCLPDAAGFFFNPGAQGLQGRPEVQASFGSRYGLAAMPQLALVAGHPVGQATRISLGAYRFGTKDLYTETTAAIGVAHSIGQTALGATVGLLQNTYGEGLTLRAPTLTIGGYSELIPRLGVGMSVANLNQPVLNAATGERVPAIYRAGLSYQAGKQVRLYTQVDKTSARQASIHAGLEYALHPAVTLRAGTVPNQGAISGGIRLALQGMVAEYGIATQQALGLCHALTLTATFPDLRYVRAPKTPPAETSE